MDGTCRQAALPFCGDVVQGPFWQPLVDHLKSLEIEGFVAPRRVLLPPKYAKIGMLLVKSYQMESELARNPMTVKTILQTSQVIN